MTPRERADTFFKDYLNRRIYHTWDPVQIVSALEQAFADVADEARKEEREACAEICDRKALGLEAEYGGIAIENAADEIRSRP